MCAITTALLRRFIKLPRKVDISCELRGPLNPSLDTLAGHACLSPFHFHRVFRAIVGENPAEYGGHEEQTARTTLRSPDRIAASLLAFR